MEEDQEGSEIKVKEEEESEEEEEREEGMTRKGKRMWKRGKRRGK